MSSRAARILWPVIWTVLGLVALGALLALNATAREVAKDTAKALFGIFATPFILEATVAIAGLLLVLGINQWRLNKEGDGWVYLATQEPDEETEKLPAAITQRLQGVVLQVKPEAGEEADTMRANIEGFLELGMAAQAAEAMVECGQLPDDQVTAALRVRVLAANLDTDAARQLLRSSAARFAGGNSLFAQTAVDCANWIDSHAPRHREAIELWRTEAMGMTK
jgi:hypothetical protein